MYRKLSTGVLAESVADSIVAEYRRTNPGKTDAQIAQIISEGERFRRPVNTISHAYDRIRMRLKSQGYERIMEGLRAVRNNGNGHNNGHDNNDLPLSEISVEGMRARLAPDMARSRYERKPTADYTAFLADAEQFLSTKPSHQIRGMYYRRYSQDA